MSIVHDLIVNVSIVLGENFNKLAGVYFLRIEIILEAAIANLKKNVFDGGNMIGLVLGIFTNIAR